MLDYDLMRADYIHVFSLNIAWNELEYCLKQPASMNNKNM